MNLSAADERFLAALVRDRAGAMVSELAERLGVSESAVRARAARLYAVGMVERHYAQADGTGQEFVFYSLSDAARRRRARR